MMSSRYGVLCFLLFLVVLLLAYENYETWSRPIQWAVQKEGAKKTEGKGEPSPAVEGVQKLSPSDSVPLIAQNNIFNPDRKEFPVPAIGDGGTSETGGPAPDCSVRGDDRR